MGDPRKRRKQFEKPLRPWDKGRLESERELKKTYGLKNKRELWRAESTLRGKRKNARKLLALDMEARIKRESELINSLTRYGVLGKSARLDDVLSLRVESLLERRLQTMVLRKGLANNIKQARQFVVHGHIALNGKKVSSPGYMVSVEEEHSIGYYKKPMILKPIVPEKKASLKEDFEQAKPEGELAGEVSEENVESPEGDIEDVEKTEGVTV